MANRFITKRNGTQEPFKQSKVDAALANAFNSCGYLHIPNPLYDKYRSIDFNDAFSVEDVQDKLEDLLFNSEYKDVYNHFVTYRANHALMREIKTKTLFDSIIGVENNEVTRENGNMNSDTPAGMMMKFASETTKAFVDKYMLSPDVKKAQDDNLLHIHDKDYYLTRSLTCLTGDTNIQLKDDRGKIINTKLNYFDSEFEDSGNLQLVKPSKYIYIQGRNGWTKVTGVSRHSLIDEEKLYKIRFGKGVELKITGDHLIPVMVDEDEKLIKVSELKPGMDVLKVGLFNESAIQDEYIDIISEINDNQVDTKVLVSNIRDLIWYLKYKYQVMNLRSWLGIPGTTNWPRGAKYITLEDYNKIRSEFDIPYEVLSTLTVKVYGGKDSLPLYLPITNELAEVFGYLHSEGCISFSQKTGSYQISFCNYDKDMRNRFKESWSKIFTNKLTEFNHDGKVVGLTGSSKLLSMLFSKILGKKANSYNIVIPNFIMNGNNDTKWHYISSLIDGDGCVKANTGKLINYTTVSRNFAEQLVILFQTLGVDAVINERDTLGRLTKFGDIISQSNSNTQSVTITGYENIEKVLSNLRCIKQNSIDAYYAEKPKKAVINTPTKIIDIIELENNNQLVYDIETVEHWWVANNVIVHNCLQHPLDKILQNGFQSGHGSARPAKRIETAAFQACISMETIQNEMHGGQAIPAFDFYMAPYVRATYIEEVNKIKELMLGELQEDDEFWDSIRNAKIDDYIIKDLPTTLTISKSRIYQESINNTVKRVHQAMESFIHNMNSIHSRGGNQVVFSSINYGTDTSAEGRCIIRELLKSTEKGVGNNTTAIFPIQIWKMKSGVSVNPGDPNYDLYKYSLQVAARRFFPNYLNLDSSFNKDDKWDINDPKRYEHEVAVMGCRTRVYENRFGPKTSIGRGNISFSTINLVKLAVEISIKDGYLIKTENGYTQNPTLNTNEDIKRRLTEFIDKCVEMTQLTARQLDERYQFQKNALAKQFPLLMKGMWVGSDNLIPEDTIENVINQGTLGIGFIGLAEAFIALTGKHHAEDDNLQNAGLLLIEKMKQEADKLSEQYQHNYAILATPAEGLSGKFTKKDKKIFGIIPGVTDKEYYTNSNHVPVYYKCSASHKAKIECPYHKLTTAGHIFYVESDYDPTKNPEAIDTINRIARDNDGGYISFNHNQGRCNYCNFESDDPNLVHGSVCPKCGKKDSWDQLSRVTGYLISTTDRWNGGKLGELRDRVTHT